MDVKVLESPSELVNQAKWIKADPEAPTAAPFTQSGAGGTQYSGWMHYTGSCQTQNENFITAGVWLQLPFDSFGKRRRAQASRARAPYCMLPCFYCREHLFEVD